MSRARTYLADYKLNIYGNFAGLNTAKSELMMESKESLPIVSMNNAFVDYRGVISNGRPIKQFFPDVEGGRVTWLATGTPPFIAQRIFVYAVSEKNDGYCRYRYAVATPNFGTGLNYTSVAVTDITLPYYYADGSRLESVQRFGPLSCEEFDGKLILGFDGHPMSVSLITNTSDPVVVEIKPKSAENAVAGSAALYYFNGSTGVTVASGRLGVIDRFSNQIKFSRVNDMTTWPIDEDYTESSVIQAFVLDLNSVFESGERIVGAKRFGASALAIYSTRQVYVYNTDPDFTKWEIDRSVKCGVAAISQLSVVDVNGDHVFCADSGIYSLRKSVNVGTIVYSVPLSSEVSYLYRKLLAECDNWKDISAVYSNELGVLSVFFPKPGTGVYRLDMAIRPAETETQSPMVRWSLSFGDLTMCATRKSDGLQFVGTGGGIAQWMDDSSSEGIRPDAEVQFPILWHTDPTMPKQSHAIALFADGEGQVTFEARDETGRDLGNVVFNLASSEATVATELPLPEQLTRPFQHQYVGLRLKMKISSQKLVRVHGFGVITKEL